MSQQSASCWEHKNTGCADINLLEKQCVLVAGLLGKKNLQLDDMCTAAHSAAHCLRQQEG